MTLRLGGKLRHPTFGDGTIVSVEKSRYGAIVSVAFPNAGIRKLAAEYIKSEWLS
jgi:hypothetical protein